MGLRRDSPASSRFSFSAPQVTARRNGFPLDKVTTETHVTKMTSPEDAAALGNYPPNGVFIHGLFLQGARWMGVEEAVEANALFKVDGSVECAGVVVESRLKELLPPMPLLYIKAVRVEDAWEPDSVGYLRPNPDIYNCPVYVTTVRGPTYTFLATLKTREAKHKWTLAGVALIMQTDD
jgi:dynein heavy chain